MSIKSDKWIRRMAEQARMIEPFAPDLVRTNDIEKANRSGKAAYGPRFLVDQHGSFKGECRRA